MLKYLFERWFKMLSMEKQMLWFHIIANSKNGVIKPQKAIARYIVHYKITEFTVEQAFKYFNKKKVRIAAISEYEWFIPSLKETLDLDKSEDKRIYNKLTSAGYTFGISGSLRDVKLLHVNQDKLLYNQNATLTMYCIYRNGGRITGIRMTEVQRICYAFWKLMFNNYIQYNQTQSNVLEHESLTDWETIFPLLVKKHNLKMKQIKKIYKLIALVSHFKIICNSLNSLETNFEMIIKRANLKFR